MSFIRNGLFSALLTSTVLAGALGIYTSLPTYAITTPQMGYAWDNNPSVAFLTPALAFQRNTTSGVNTIQRVSPGNYFVQFPGLATPGGTVDVSTYGATTNSCEVAFWGPVGSQEIVNVRCFAINGSPADTQFTVAFIDAVGTGTIDYVWANQPSLASYTPDLVHQHNGHGTPNTVTRTAPGVYQVHLPGDGGPRGDVQVTAFGATAHTCSVIKFGTLGPDQQVDVICFAPGGAPADTQFVLTYTNLADLAGDQALPFGYAWDTQPTVPTFFPPITFGYSNGVPAGPITRLSAGRWQVRLPNTKSSVSGGDVQVTAGFAGQADRCQVVGWNSDIAANTLVRVNCENSQGGPSDVPFVVSFFH